MDISKLTVSYLDGFVGIPKPEGFAQKDKVLPYMTVVYPKTGYYDIRVEDGPFQRLELYITKPFQRHTIVRHAQECGFCDEFHLSRSFKKHYGISPREYRNSVSDL